LSARQRCTPLLFPGHAHTACTPGWHSPAADPFTVLPPQASGVRSASHNPNPEQRFARTLNERSRIGIPPAMILDCVRDGVADAIVNFNDSLLGQFTPRSV